MKKIFFFCVGLALSVTTMAQNTNVTTKLPQNHNLEGNTNTDNSSFGIKGGVNFNQLRGADKDNLTDLKNQTTWHAGIFGQFPIRGSQKFSVQVEALFNRRAFESDSLEVKMDNIEVPFLFVFNPLDNISVHAGPYAGVLMTAKENEKEVPERIKKMMNSFNYGLAAGAEARLSVLRLGARYSLDLNEIYKEKRNINNRAVQDIKNGMFQVYLGVGF